MQAFLHALVNRLLVAVPAEGVDGGCSSFLKLPPGVFFLGDRNLGGELYVRNVYTQLSSEVFGGGGSPQCALVTGTAGTGKS